MAMGRKDRERQDTMWIAASEIARSEGHVFYRALNRLFQRHGFDDFVEGLVQKSRIFANGVGRPSVPPGVYFRMSMVGYFEGLTSERGIAWRCADSMSLREFLGYELTQETPDHSTLSRWRRNLPEKVHREVFEWVVGVAREEKILKGRRIAIDSTTMEANAAMKSIVRKADGATYQEYLKKLAKAEGIETPTPQDLQRMDRKRRGRKTSNKEWKSRTDSHARITRMKDGRTRMGYKVENAMDVQSRITVAAEVHLADQGDPATVEKTLQSADATVMNAGVAGGIRDVVLDRGYHADSVLEHLDEKGVRGYVAEPKRGRRNWTKQRRRDGDERVARRRRVYYGNRRRSRSRRGRLLQRLRAEFPERGFAHLKRTGGLARVFVRGRREVTKKVQSYVAAANLSVILHALLGMGTPRGLQGRLREALAAFLALCRFLIARLAPPSPSVGGNGAFRDDLVSIARIHAAPALEPREPAYATDC
jgi:transposase